MKQLTLKNYFDREILTDFKNDNSDGIPLADRVSQFKMTFHFQDRYMVREKESNDEIDNDGQICLTGYNCN